MKRYRIEATKIERAEFIVEARDEEHARKVAREHIDEVMLDHDWEFDEVNLNDVVEVDEWGDRVDDDESATEPKETTNG